MCCDKKSPCTTNLRKTPCQACWEGQQPGSAVRCDKESPSKIFPGLAWGVVQGYRVHLEMWKVLLEDCRWVGMTGPLDPTLFNPSRWVVSQSALTTAASSCFWPIGVCCIQPGRLQQYRLLYLHCCHEMHVPHTCLSLECGCHAASLHIASNTVQIQNETSLPATCCCNHSIVYDSWHHVAMYVEMHNATYTMST